MIFHEIHDFQWCHCISRREHRLLEIRPKFRLAVVSQSIRQALAWQTPQPLASSAETKHHPGYCFFWVETYFRAKPISAVPRTLLTFLLTLKYFFAATFVLLSRPRFWLSRGHLLSFQLSQSFGSDCICWGVSLLRKFCGNWISQILSRLLSRPFRGFWLL